MNVIGEKYGRLTPLRKDPDSGQDTRWFFRCDCGVEKSINLNNVKRGLTESCGCLRREIHTRHGQSIKGKRSRESAIYSAMKDRCTNPNNQEYPRYGGRGISICDRWMNSAAAFLEDMGPAPTGHSIDRIDTNGNYEPGNCRWATIHEQARNRRNNTWVEAPEGRMVLKDYAAFRGVNYMTLYHKVRRMGKSAEQGVAEILAKNASSA